MSNSKKWMILILAIILGLDLLTKILAYNLLPFQEHVYLLGDKISLYSTYNEGSSGGQADYLISKSGLDKNNVIFWGTINWMVFSIYIILIDRLKSKNKKKWLLLIPLFIINLILLEVCLKVFPNTAFSNHFISWFSKIGIIGFLCVLTYLTKEKWTKVFLICLIGAGFGNALSHFYPPYHIVDFISVKGSYELIKIGVFNVADAITYLSVVLLILNELYQSIKKKVAKTK